jgi:RHS repeat-associated protein
MISITNPSTSSVSIRCVSVLILLTILCVTAIPTADAQVISAEAARGRHLAAARDVAPALQGAARRPSAPVDQSGRPLPSAQRVSGQVAALTTSVAQNSRLGLNELWTYTSQDYGGGNSSYVNVSSGNVVVQHRGGAIPALGFDVDLTHTYNSQDSYGRNKSSPDAGAWYGEGWSFAMDLRLIELNGGSSVVFKDGTGLLRSYPSNGNGSYGRQQWYGYSLIKTTSNPADKLYTLTSDVGAIKHYFNAAGQRTRVEDRNGNFLIFEYDLSSRLTTITDSASRKTILEYAGLDERLSKITDMAGRVSTYTYDSAGNLATATHGSGTTDAATTTFTYGSTSQLTRVANPRGHESQIAYKIEHQWDTASNVEGWAVTSGPATIAQSTAQKYAGSGSLQVSVTGLSSVAARIERTLTAPNNTFGSTPLDLVAFVYVPTGAPTIQAQLYVQHSGAQESVTSSLATGQWNLVRLEAAQVDLNNPATKLGLSFTALSGSYSGALYVDQLYFANIAASLSDAKTAHTKLALFSYAWSSRATTIQRPDQAGANKNWTYEYSAAGQVAKLTDPLNNVTQQAYTTALQLSSVTLPGGSASTYALTYYPNSNQLQTFANELGETSRRGADTTNGDTRYQLDPLNEQRSASGAQTFEALVYSRDGAGNVTGVATNRYAAGSNLEQTTLPSPSQTLRTASYTYDSGGVIASMIDANNNVTNFAYQIATGYLTQIDAPAGNGEATRRVTTITPNSDGSVQKVVDPKGQTTTFEYDGLGRLKKINYGVVSGAPAFSVSYTLDKNGNLTAMSDQAGSTSWVYDENNHLTSEARTQNGATKTASYAYYANGDLKTITTFASQTSTLGYDAALRLVSQTDPKDAGRTISYRYDSRGRRDRITYGSGAYQELTYDKADRVDLLTLKTSGGAATRQSFDYYYGFNSSGVRQADYNKGNVISVTELDGSTVTYGYDGLNRLTSAVRTGTFAFNQSYSYDGNDNRTSVTAGGVTTNATYDAVNQLKTLGSASYSYDRNGNLTAFGSNSLTYDAANNWTGGSVSGSSVSFGYDGLGRRTNRSVAGSRTDFWYDLTGLTLETGAASATYLRDPAGAPLSVYNGTLYNYGRDRLGSVTGLITTGGSLNTSYAYDPWGQSIGGTGTAYNALRFTGVYFDSATSLYRMTRRFYQPASGRFTQLDPLPESIIARNRYAYVNCNPVNAVDPSGLAPCTPRQTFLNTLGGVVTVATGIAGILALGSVTGGAAAVAGAVVAEGAILYGVATATYCYGNEP